MRVVSALCPLYAWMVVPGVFCDGWYRASPGTGEDRGRNAALAPLHAPITVISAGVGVSEAGGWARSLCSCGGGVGGGELSESEDAAGAAPGRMFRVKKG